MNFVPKYANSVDAFIPELWANESLAILEENMVVGNLVHRDFSNEVANFGDTVNTRKPAEFTAKRKGVNDDVVIQDVSATNVAVKLNQLLHTSFLIRDGEESKSFKDLVNEYLRPAMLAQARFVDMALVGQLYQYLAYTYGKLGGLSTSNAVDYMTGVREVMNTNKVPMDGRNLILTTAAETKMLQNEVFHSAEKVGDEGTALREASLGRKFGFNTFMAQNTPSIASGNTLLAGAINNTGGYAKGTTVLTVDSFTGAVVTGGWLTVVGDDTPQRITAHTETTGNTTEITVSPGLRHAVADNAVVNAYTPGAVNFAAGYAAGYDGTIVIDGFTVAPKVGQLVSFGTAAHVYTVMEATTTTLLLDRPLEAAISDNDVVGIGPAGDYNFAVHRNALALVIRPLSMPKQGTGALAGVASYNNFSMRVVITYNGTKQGHLVTLDMLFGVKVLDTLLGAVLFA